MIELDLAWLKSHPLPGTSGNTDKNARGRVLAAGGSETVPGGLLLTAEAVLRAGAGKVQLATVERAALPVGLAMPEAASFPLPANAKGELAVGAGTILADRLDRCDALVLGPGTGPEADTAAIVEELAARAPESGALLLDAAMIPAAHALEGKAGVWAGHRVMTPHFGEMAALMGCGEDDVTPALAARAAERFAATVVLKASQTWISTAGGDMLHYAGGGPGLATAGSGDVLAGIIGGLLARGTPPEVAAAWGVWLHGEAGRCLTGRVGKLGFLARELLSLVPVLMDMPMAE